MINSKIKKALAISLTAITFATTCVSAKSFSDVSRTGSFSWAFSAIDELSDKNVISGYPDGTYKPEAPVSFPEVMQLIVQVVNPSESEIKEAKDKYEKLLNEKDTPDWAKKAFSVALYRGIVSETEFKDAADKGFLEAKEKKYPIRKDIAVFFARALKLSSSGDKSYLRHDDLDQIPDNVKGYLASLVKAGIFTSTGSDGKFNGDKEIRRSEMAIIVKAGFDYMSSHAEEKPEAKTGKVILASKLNNTNVLIIEEGKSKYSFELNDQTKYKTKDKTLKFDDLQAGQEVKVEYVKSNSSDKLGLAKTVEITSLNQNLVGYVNSKTTNTITIKYTENSSKLDFRTTSKVSTSDSKTFEFASDAKITAYGNKIELDKVSTDDLVEFKLNSDGKISEMIVFPKEATVKGKVTSISTSTSTGEVKLKLSDNKEYTFYITKDTKSSLNNVKVNDTIYLKVNYKVAIDIGDSADNLVSGLVTDFASRDVWGRNNGYIEIRVNNYSPVKYELAWNVRYVNGSSQATNPQARDSDYIGMYVQLELDSNGKVSVIRQTDKAEYFTARGQVVDFQNSSSAFSRAEYDLIIKIIQSDNSRVGLGKEYSVRVYDRSFSKYDIVELKGYVDDRGNAQISYVTPVGSSSYEVRPDSRIRDSRDFDNWRNLGASSGDYFY
ncbi:S-layer homology domain-containing protein [uncultured Peptoniphilus sp.]|uniref:S-layer homology domain-containing protein n=1 Tax=uncultured Peptoniphilus sp. TaxID=254354 RepID=UPI002803D782|nr:S-layer homology domain-containing protein [uncultured Peptoniphilus sp.]